MVAVRNLHLRVNISPTPKSKPINLHRKAKEVIASDVSTHGVFWGEDGLSHLLFIPVLFLPLLQFHSLENYRQGKKKKD